MSNWDSFVSILKACDCKEFNNVKVVMMAQAIVETGRGSSELFNIVKNPFGMKYRDFLWKFASKYKYYTDSEPLRKEDDGSGKMERYDYFCAFDEHLPAILCYCHKIREQSAYEACKQYVDNPKQFLKEVSKVWAVDDKYEEKVLAVYDEAETLLQAPKEISLINLKKEFDAHMIKFHSDKVVPKNKLKVMLNAGHAGTSGASGKEVSITESVENLVTVAEIKSLLEKDGDYIVTIVNQNDNNIGLEGVGKATKDYDIAIAVHYNAADKVEHGTEVLVGIGASKSTKDFAKLLCDEIVLKLGYQNRGVKEKSLSVFKGYNSIENNKCLFVLSEGQFIDDETSLSECRKKSLLNAQAHVEAIKKYKKSIDK